ncbi:FKBP12-associated protein, partial [Marasmius crinis-equi]
SWDAGSIVAIVYAMLAIVDNALPCVANLGSFVNQTSTLARHFAMLRLYVQKTNPVKLLYMSLVPVVESVKPFDAGKAPRVPMVPTDFSQNRNARLADALGIKAEGRGNAGSEATYNDELVAFAKTNMKFLGLVETTFAEFVNSPKRTQVLPQMPPERRKFVHDLAHVYRLDTQMVDQEPHRSVQIIRRIDTRIPHPLLSAHIASSTPSAPSLGKLGNLRGGTVTGPSWRKPTAPGGQNIAAPTASTPSSSSSRGWTSVVARATPPANTRSTPPIPSTNVSATPSRTGTPDRVPAGASTVPAVRGSGSTTASAPPASTPDEVPDDWEDDA